MNLINGNTISSSLLNSLKFSVDHLKALQITPKLCVILLGNDVASHIYVQNKIRFAKEVGIEVDPHFLSESTPETEISNIIEEANNNTNTHGVLIQLPLPTHLNSYDIINKIHYSKDVDGFTVHNIGLLNSWQECLEPSTPQGALILIKSVLGENLQGKKAVVLGRSIIVGRPMCSMLIRESCTVTLVHSLSHNIEDECRNADIIVSAIGKPAQINASYIKDGACIIDVGITRVGNKLFGDVDIASLENKNVYITPVPGGVGPMTVACMLKNTVKACLVQNKITSIII